MKRHREIMACKHKHKSSNTSLLLFGVANFLWFLFRTGSKPSRIVYPCQRAALANTSILLGVSIPLAVTIAAKKTEKFLSRKATTLVLLIILGSIVVIDGQFWRGLQPVLAVNPNQEIELILELKNATVFPASDIYVVNVRRASERISELVNLMGLHGLIFYKSNVSGANQGPNGLIAHDDVVLIKINMQWSQRGGTNTDILKELIQAIVDHPDGFVGEIVVADNGQGWGSMDWYTNNAEDRTQSTQDVVNMFSPLQMVSTYDWQPIRDRQVDEYSEGDMTDGYILQDTVDPETRIRVSYPKFKTEFGTYISFKHGVWNGTGYEKRLKVINVPVLKSHNSYGVTASLKHYMGVQSEGRWGGLGNGHFSVGSGGMGTLMVELGLPTLNIIDAIWVNANPPPSALEGPSTPYLAATRVNVLAASLDPVALDYWAAKHVLVQAATVIGYSDTHTLDPDSADRTGVEGEAFGIWLNRTKDEIITGGYNVTTNVDHMNVFISTQTIHDVAVTSVMPLETAVRQGCPLNIGVTVQNQGDFNEDFNVTIYANDTAIETETVTLPCRGCMEITFTWNTTSVDLGNYTISAVADIVTSETDVVDNIYIDGIVTIRLPIHDIAVIEVTPFKTIVGEGYPISINVTVENQGEDIETFNVTAYFNDTAVVLQNGKNYTTVILQSGSSTVITLTCNASDLATGNYAISAYATPVLGETDTTDNMLTDGWVIVAISGDVDGDFDVDILDIVTIASNYGCRLGSARYNPNFDIDNDGQISILDISICATHYGQKARKSLF